MNRVVFDSQMNLILSPLLQLDPALTIFIIAFVISGVMAVVNKKVMGSPKSKKLKEKLEKSQKLRKDMLDAQKLGDTKKVESLTKKSWELQSKYLSEYTKMMMRPMIISIILVILILPFLSSTYRGEVVASIPKIIPIVGGRTLTWLWWYIICSISLSVVMRRLLE